MTTTTPCILLCPAPASDAPAATTNWVPGAVSVSLALASYALTWAGYTQSSHNDCAMTDVYGGAMFAIASLGTAIPGLLLGLFGAACGRTNRLFPALGAVLSAAFFGAFYMVWL